MKQRIRPLLLMRKRSAMFQRVGQHTYALANRLMDDTLFGAPKPFQGWTDGEDCAGGGNVALDFTAPVFFTDGTLGITITATGGNNYTLSGALTSGQNDISYTGAWDTPLVAGDVVTVSYDENVGDYNDGALAPDTAFVRSFNWNADNCLNPPVLLSATATSQSVIVLRFDREIGGTETLGVTFGGTTAVTVSGSSGLPGFSITYNINETLFNDSDVTWSYAEVTGDLVRTDSGEPLEDVVSFPVDVSSLPGFPPVVNNGWATESGGRWKTESGGDWLLENFVAAFVTYLGQPVTYSGVLVTHG